MTPEIRRLLSEVAAGEIGPAVAARAKALLDRESAHRARVRAKARPRLDAKARREEEARREHERRTGLVRIRAEGRCELCRVLDLEHVHHLEPGRGTRRRRESVANTIGLCVKCHDGIHRDEAAFVPAVRAWCLRHGYPLPMRKVYR